MVYSTIWLVAQAQQVFRDRFDFNDGGIVEIVIWRVPEAVPPTTHGLKYSLFYGRPGLRLVGYDNERGKGGTVERLIEDFWADVEALRGER
jgi:hypothetical protein